MKIYEYIKKDNERIAKLLGFPVMEQTSSYMTAERYQSFAGGLVTTIKINNIYSDHTQKDILILGKSIIKRIEEDSRRTYYIFGKKVRTVSLINEFKKQYFKYFNKKYDDIYILTGNSGETYLTLTYVIDALIKKNGSKKPLLIATQKNHVDIIKMICPDIDYVYIKNLNRNITIDKDNFNINNFRFFLLYSHAHFKQVEIDIKSDQIGMSHYFKSLLNRLNLTESDIQMKKAAVLPEAEKSMFEKINKTGLNLEKFVFLAPEAKSCKLYDEDFWVLLINELQKKGYDVFVNLTGNDIKLTGAMNYKTCYLTFAEAFALAKRAKKIVSLRSGFTEFLLQTGVPMDVLYTKFRRRHVFDDMDIYHVMSGFGLSQIPYVDKSKIREFNMFEVSQKECLEDILKVENE